MNSNTQPESDSALWLENLVDGLAGITIKAKHAVYCDSSPYQKIEVFDTYSFGRILLLGGTIVLTERDEHIYNEMITHPALVTHGNARNICIIGGGDGGCLRQVLKHDSVESIVVVDIDTQVTETVRKHFPTLAAGFDDKRVEMIFEDGCEWLEKCDRSFDVIIVDSYDPGGPVHSLETSGFFEHVRGRLNEGGIAAIQTGAPQLKTESIRRTYRDISSLFAYQKPFFAALPSFPLGICSFVLCGTNDTAQALTDNAPSEELCSECRYYCRDVHKGAFLLPASMAGVFSV